MHLLQRLIRRAYVHVADLRWGGLVALVAAHAGLSWALLFLAGEDDVGRADTFWYFYVVTATTVGYGDVSPETPVGRAVTVLWIMPGGIALFGAALGKIVADVGGQWRGRMNGEADFDEVEGAIVLVGWHGERTRAMIRQIVSGGLEPAGQPVVLITDGAGPARNPEPEIVLFIRARGLTNAAELRRGGIERARRVVVYAADDGQTLAAALAVAALNPRCHLVAHFEDAATAGLLKAHHPPAECLVDLTHEMLARAVQDPGSSHVTRIMSTSATGGTLFSLTVPRGVPEALTFGAAFHGLRERFAMTCLGLAPQGPEDEDVILNPALDHPLGPGDVVYYLADERVLADDVDWRALGPRAGPSVRDGHGSSP